MDNKDFSIPDTISTTRGVNNKLFISFLRSYQNLYNTCFYDSYFSFKDFLDTNEKILTSELLTDEGLRNDLFVFKNKILNFYNEFLRLELEMFLLKDEILKKQTDYSQSSQEDS